MIKKLTILFLFSIMYAVPGFSQSMPYLTTSGEMIFSLANIEDHGTDQSSILRWAPVFNIQVTLNKDLNNKFGLFSGLAVRNVGYIYGNYLDPVTENIFKKKFRSYNLALPLGIKVGNLEGLFFYGGYEIELPFLYKEKTFEGGDKINTITGWFSNREQLFQHGFLVGVEFPYGFNIKFKYYLSEFHNQDFIDSGGYKPYTGLKANIFYFSLSSYMFKKYYFRSVTRDNSDLVLLH